MISLAEKWLESNKYRLWNDDDLSLKIPKKFKDGSKIESDVNFNYVFAVLPPKKKKLK